MQQLFHTLPMKSKKNHACSENDGCRCDYHRSRWYCRRHRIITFLEALRQMKADMGSDNVMYIHTTLIPYLKAAGEMKTKPTQHSVKELRSLGIQPNILVVRTELPVSQNTKTN